MSHALEVCPPKDSKGFVPKDTGEATNGDVMDSHIGSEVIELYESILTGDRKKFPLGFWGGEEGKRYAAILTRYLLKKTGTKPTEATKETFQKNKLSSILHLFNGSTYAIIENAYPGVYKPWELVQTPMGYWTSEGWQVRARDATRWMVENKLDCPVDKLPTRLDYRTFHANGLGGMINIAFNESLFDAVENAYPGRFRPWEFKRIKIPWTPQLAAEALHWLVLEKLRITPQEAVGRVSYAVIVEHNLLSAYRVLGSSLRRLMINAFPELKYSYKWLKESSWGPSQSARLRRFARWSPFKKKRRTQ